MDIYQDGQHGQLSDHDRNFEFASDLCKESTEMLVRREVTSVGGALVGANVELVFGALISDI